MIGAVLQVVRLCPAIAETPIKPFTITGALTSKENAMDTKVLCSRCGQVSIASNVPDAWLADSCHLVGDHYEINADQEDSWLTCAACDAVVVLHGILFRTFDDDDGVSVAHIYVAEITKRLKTAGADYVQHLGGNRFEARRYTYHGIWPVAYHRIFAEQMAKALNGDIDLAGTGEGYVFCIINSGI